MLQFCKGTSQFTQQLCKLGIIDTSVSALTIISLGSVAFYLCKRKNSKWVLHKLEYLLGCFNSLRTFFCSLRIFSFACKNSIGGKFSLELNCPYFVMTAYVIMCFGLISLIVLIFSGFVFWTSFSKNYNP